MNRQEHIPKQHRQSTTPHLNIMGAFPPMGQSRTINMFVSITEITMGSLGGSVLCRCTGKHTHTHVRTRLMKTASYLSRGRQLCSLSLPLHLLDPIRIILSLPSHHPVPWGGLNTTTPVIISHLWSLQHERSKGTPGTSRQHHSCELLFLLAW